MNAKLMKMVAAHQTLNALISLDHFAVYAEAVSKVHRGSFCFARLKTFQTSSASCEFRVEMDLPTLFEQNFSIEHSIRTSILSLFSLLLFSYNFALFSLKI